MGSCNSRRGIEMKVQLWLRQFVTITNATYHRLALYGCAFRSRMTRTALFCLLSIASEYTLCHLLQVYQESQCKQVAVVL